MVADEAFGRQIPFAFLEKVREEWFQKWASKGTTAFAHSLDRSFGYGVGVGCVGVQGGGLA